MNLIKLNIVGLSYSQFKSGAYALFLEDEKGGKKLSIVIGACEAQSIAISLDKSIISPRPLTHDLFKTFGDSFDISIQKVVIHTLIEGIFHASFHCKHKLTKEEVAIDARTSDAIALAIRYSCPIFTYEDILARAGIIISSATEDKDNIELDLEEDKNAEPQGINTFSVAKLKKMLATAIEEEDYEKASEIRDEINKRKGN